MIVSVERVDVSLTGTSATAALTKGQDETKCVPFATRLRSAATGAQDDGRVNNVDVEIFDDGGTPTVRVLRGLSTDSISITVYVVEFGPDVTVQQGTFSATGVASTTAAIAAVDLSESFLISHYRTNHTALTDRFENIAIRGRFSSTTQLTFSRNGIIGDFDGHWYVVEDAASLWSVQSGTITLGTSEVTKTATISAVTTSKAFVVVSHESTRNNDDADRGAVRVDLQDSTTVRAIRGRVDNTITVEFYVVEFTGDGEVRRGLISFLSSEVQKTASFALVSNKSSAHSPVRHLLESSAPSGTTDGKSHVDGLVRLRIDNDRLGITADRVTAKPSAIEYAWEVVDWASIIDYAFSFVADADFTVSELTLESALAIALTADADFTISLDSERPIALSFQADADFTATLGQTHTFSFLNQIDPNFQLSSQFTLVFDHAAQVDADFDTSCDVERGVLCGFTADADFTLALGRIRPFAFSMEAEANFQTGGLVLDSAFSLAFVADADFLAAMEIEKALAFAFQADGDFTVAALERARELVHAFTADADFSQQLGVERPIAVDFEADGNFIARVEFDERLLAFTFQADADFTQFLEVERPIAHAFTADADFVQDLDGGRSIAFALEATADFLAEIDRRPDFIANVEVDADFTLGLTRSPCLAFNFVGEANFQSITTSDLLLEFALQVDADFIENFVEAQRLIFVGFDATADFNSQFDRQPIEPVSMTIDANFQMNPLTLTLDQRLNFVADANFDITALLNSIALTLSLSADADFSLEIGTDRLPGVRVFTVPGTPGAFVIPESSVFLVPLDV